MSTEQPQGGETTPPEQEWAPPQPAAPPPQQYDPPPQQYAPPQQYPPQQQYPPVGYPPVGYPPVPGRDPDEGKTVQILGYVLAGASALFPILALAALILGIITATKPHRRGHGFAIIGLSVVIGIGAFVFWASVNTNAF